MADQVDARLPLDDITRMEEKVDGEESVSELKEDTTQLEEDECNTAKGEEEHDVMTAVETSDSSTEEDVKTAVEMETFCKVGNTIHWSKLDEESRLAHDKRVESCQKPSMWEFDPKGGVPTELANLVPSTFLTSRQGYRFCSLPKNVFARICAKLSVWDFLNLSLTCRFLHWRMFTFCTCYTPYTVHMIVHDKRVSESIPPIQKLTYILNKGVLDEMIEDAHKTEFMKRYISQQKGRRGICINQPFCLRKPFFFETLELEVTVPFNCKLFYDRCLPYILGVRGLVRNLDLLFCNNLPESRSFNIFNDTNDFLKAVNASYYQNFYRCDDLGMYSRRNNIVIYINCPYARQMNRVCVDKEIGLEIIDVPVFENTIGMYRNPLDSAIIATLKNFLSGSTNLAYHQYLQIEEDNDRFPLIEYLFQEFGKFKRELFYEQRNLYIASYCDYYMWEKVVETENGGQLRIVIKKPENGIIASVRIGKEETFDELDEKYGLPPIYHEDDYWWVMETAVEPDEDEEPETESSSDDCRKQDEPEESDEDEEEQEAYGACLCLKNSSCSIQ